MSRWAEAMLLWSWQSLLLILVIVVVARVFRFRSAADRYAFWLIGVAAVAALPLANAFVKTLPPVKIAVPSAGEVAHSISVSSGPALLVSPGGEVQNASVQSNSTARQPISWPPIVSAVLFAAWCAGVVSYLFRPCRSYWQSRRLRHSAHRDSIGPSWARVGYSEYIHAPVTLGILHPMILLPSDIRDWATPEERHAVVLHELAHVERRDPIVNLFQTLVGAVLFFHPAVRYALRRLVLERELACDERVLDAGARPAAYADILLKVAERSFAKPETYQLAFNTSGKILDRRVTMIFNYRSSIPGGSSLIRTARASAVLALAILLLPQRNVTFEASPTTFVRAVPVEAPPVRETATITVAVVQAATPTHQPPSPSEVTGTVRDPRGAPMPGVTVFLINAATGARQTILTNRQGEFSFAQIDPGSYIVEASMPGFAGYQGNFSLPSATQFRQDITLQLAGGRGLPAGGVIGQAVQQAPVQAQPTNLSGTVSDQSGARVPGVMVRLSSTVGGSPQSVVTNETGAYQFSQITPGQYTFSGSLPGFQTFSRTVVVRAGNTNTEDAVLHVGRTVTSVEVSTSAPQTTNVLPPPSPLRIGGTISAPTLLSAPKPQYPAAARAQGIQGFVQLLGVVDANGQVVSLQPDPSQGSGNFHLVQAAMEAARQWRYRPATLNGQPIEFPTTITVNFTFQ